MKRRLLLAVGLALLLMAPRAAAALNTNACSNATTSVTVTTSSTPVIGIKSNRKLLILHNVSDTAMDCNLVGGTAAGGSGLYIPASAAWTFDVVVPGGAVACINATGSKEIRVCEGT